MLKNLLFAIDFNTEEVIISESPKGTNEIIFIERLTRQKNEVLYDAVIALTTITRSSTFDLSIFKAMDKVCHMIYHQHKEIS